MDDIFSYDIYPDSEGFVVKVRFDHLKHHKIVAFPAPLLLKEKPMVISQTVSTGCLTAVNLHTSLLYCGAAWAL